MKLIYIAGTSHSGSTLLDLMLNAHPDIISGGELRRFHERLHSKKRVARCTCGAPSLLECDFWSKVDTCVREMAGRSLAELDVADRSEVDPLRSPSAILLQSMAQVSRKGFIVDSSKSPEHLAYLLRIKGLDVFPIHLIRDPKGQVNSMRRKYGGLWKHILTYDYKHWRLQQMLQSVPHAVVHYEDLVSSPKETLALVLNSIGIDFDPRQLNWAEAEKHHVAGNRMRFKQTNQLMPDETWKRNLSPIHKLAIQTGTMFVRSALPSTGYQSPRCGDRYRPTLVGDPR